MDPLPEMPVAPLPDALDAIVAPAAVATLLLFFAVALLVSRRHLMRRAGSLLSIGAFAGYAYVSSRVLAFGLLWPGQAETSAYGEIPGVTSFPATCLLLVDLAVVFVGALLIASRRLTRTAQARVPSH